VLRAAAGERSRRGCRQPNPCVHRNHGPGGQGERDGAFV